jgi:hypothetical protein
MITLIDLLKIKGIDLGKYKIHLATGNMPSPLELFLDGRFKDFQEEQNSRNFPCENIVGLINLVGDKWLFAGVYKVLGVGKGSKTPYLYQTELVPDQDDLIGRVIVRFERNFRNAYIWGHKYGEDLEVAEVKPSALSIADFPGYNDVIISHRMLKRIIARKEPSWNSALSNVKGVYLIVDTSNGKKYVGSATGEGGIWARWESYIDTGHGENAELMQLISMHGTGYADNYQYSILEIAGSHSPAQFIQNRESYWKDVLLTRQFGYNSN